MVLSLLGLGASLVGAGINAHQASKAPKKDTSGAEKYLQVADELEKANTVEKVAEQSSKLSAQQGDVAGAAAQAQARTANMSRAASAAIGANAASQNILNGYSQNFNTVAGFNNQKIANTRALGSDSQNIANAKYDSDKAKWGAEMGAASSLAQSGANLFGSAVTASLNSKKAAASLNNTNTDKENA